MRFRGAYCTLGWVKSNKNSPSQLYMHLAVLFRFIYCTVQYCTVYSYILSFSLMLSGFLITNQTSYPYFLLCYAAGQTFEETKQLIIFRLETNPSSATKHFSSFLIAQLPVTLCNKLSYWWIAAPTSFPIGLTAMPHILVTPPPIGLQQLIAISQGTNSLIGGQQHQQAFLLVRQQHHLYYTSSYQHSSQLSTKLSYQWTADSLVALKHSTIGLTATFFQ